MRFNNIGIEPIQYPPTKNKTQKDKGFAIVKYHPNRYFGLLDLYLSNGWVDEGSHLSSKKIKISKECFKDIETSYVLAFVHLYPEENETILKSVGDRILFIEDSEEKDFFQAYKKANECLINN